MQSMVSTELLLKSRMLAVNGGGRGFKRKKEGEIAKIVASLC